MNKLPNEKRVAVLQALVEGNSVRSTSRMTGVARNTILSLLADAGRACSEYQDKALRSLPCKRVQCDEIWSFVYAKAKNVPTAKAAPKDAGDVWTWTALDADTKLVPSWYVGNRDMAAAEAFIFDLKGRLAKNARVQITTDGHSVYLQAIDEAWHGEEVDYAMLQKVYGLQDSDHRYSPATCVGARKLKVMGSPDPAHVSTSYVERANLSMRMGMRRFTRLTNAFSKKLENHVAAISLYFMHYNFCRVHQTLRVTPAMEAGVTDHVWEVEELVALLDREPSN